jgi:hypothetical protein
LFHFNYFVFILKVSSVNIATVNELMKRNFEEIIALKFKELILFGCFTLYGKMGNGLFYPNSYMKPRKLADLFKTKWF